LAPFVDNCQVIGIDMVVWYGA